MRPRWTTADEVRLLENGEAFFPAVFEAIREARREIIVETFILWDDKVGQALHVALRDAAARGVSVDLMVDGFGSAELTPAFIAALTEVGVRVRTFDPCPRLFGIPASFVRHFKVLRRMHRKIVVIDAARAFVGGINYSGDHLADYGPQAKQDYAVEVRGAVVHDIRRFALSAIRSDSPARDRPAPRPSPPLPSSPPSDEATPDADAGPTGRLQALFVTRDNVEHHNDIERQYRLAIRGARRRVMIANAYFFPGYRLLRELTRAARRGVEVTLILQGEPDMAIVKSAHLLYERLLRAGVRIHEYCERPLHGKVAVIDDDWSTVGSSNLDPLSLSLNLEANVVLRDPAFAAELAGRLEDLVANKCRRVTDAPPAGWAPWRAFRAFVTFHVVRGFPGWAARLPRHAPRLELPPQPDHAR